MHIDEAGGQHQARGVDLDRRTTIQTWSYRTNAVLSKSNIENLGGGAAAIKNGRIPD
jgi:hypothetical protein